MTHYFGVRKGEEGRGGFSAQLAYMIHLTELSSPHCTATNTCLRHFLCQYHCLGSRLSESLQTNTTDSTISNMPVWMFLKLFWSLQCLNDLSCWQEAAQAAYPRRGHRTTVGFFFSSLSWCAATSSRRLILVLFPIHNIFVLSGRVLAMAVLWPVREPPTLMAPITLSCHADGPLMAHAGDLGKLLPAVPN